MLAILLTGCAELHPLESLSYKTPVTKVYSDPTGAEIFVDGVSKGETPLTLIWNYEDEALHIPSKKSSIKSWAVNARKTNYPLFGC